MSQSPSASPSLAADPMSGIRPQIAALPESRIVKVADYGRSLGKEILPLWFGEGDVPTPDFICEAAARAMRDGMTFYTEQRGIPALRQALADYLTGLHGTDVAEQRIVVTSSGMQAILLTLQALVGPGDEIAVVTPVWPNIFSAAHLVGAVARQVPARFAADAGWHLDLEALFTACGPATKAIFINSPCNPTGWIMPREEMIRVRDFARERGLWIVSDEVYGRFTFDRPAPAPSFLEICDDRDRLVVVNTFSKCWAMTGWRVGWAVVPRGLGPTFENLVQYNTSGTPAFLQQAAVTALTEGEGFVAEMVERCRQGRDLVCARLSGLERVRVHPPAGAFYLFFGVAGEADSLALACRLIDEAGVGLAPGSAFGDAGEGFLRLCFAGSPAFLERALDRLVPVLTR